VRKDFLEFSPPVIGDDEVNAVVETLRSFWITTGPKTKEFEKKFAGKFGAPAALAVNSCTAALHTALVGLGIGPGDEVITTPMTFCSTVNVIEQVGARPVLVDVEPDTLNIDPDKIEDAVTTKTKAIMPVHYSGHPVDLDAIYDIAERHNLFVVEDAAHAVSAKYKGRYIGTGGTVAAFSFYATKNMTTAEGGMLTGTPDFVEKCRIISLHGMSRDAWNRYSKEGSWYYEVLLPGFKYNMTDIQASLGLVQLEKLESFQLRRAEIVAKYNQEFKNYDALEIPVAKAEVEHAWHLYVLKLNLEALRINRNQFIEELKVRNIGTSVHFIPIHLHPYYRDKYGYKPEDFPVAFNNYQRILSLPLHAGLSDNDVQDVIAAVVEIVKKYSR